MRDDILGSLRNALERGASMEQAIRSLVNSGYAESDVREAADQLTPGALSTTESFQHTKQFSTHKLPKQSMRPPSSQQEKSIVHSTVQYPTTIKKGKTGTIILLVVILLILISLLAFTIIFREKIIEFISNLF